MRGKVGKQSCLLLLLVLIMSCIPDKFIQLLLGGHGLFDVDLDDSVEKSNKSKVQSLTFSIAQDL